MSYRVDNYSNRFNNFSDRFDNISYRVDNYSKRSNNFFDRFNNIDRVEIFFRPLPIPLDSYKKYNHLRDTGNHY